MLHPTTRKVLLVTMCMGLTALLVGCKPQHSAQTDPKHDANYQRGQTLMSQMDYPGAITEFKRALITNPESAPAHLELGFLYKDYADDPAAAIYHFNNYLVLDPETDQAKLIRQNVDNCKMQLAKLFLIAPVVPNVKKEITQLKKEVKTLKQENHKLKWQINAMGSQSETTRPLLTSTPAKAEAPKTPVVLAASVTPQPKPEAKPDDKPRLIAAASTDSRKIHTIGKGEYPAKIARRYGIKLEALLRANPGINPRKMQIGDKVRIPKSG